MIDYRKVIKYKREQLNLSQIALAKKAGISQPFLHEIESGKKGLSIENFFVLCEVLGITILPEFQGEEWELKEEGPFEDSCQ